MPVQPSTRYRTARRRPASSRAAGRRSAPGQSRGSQLLHDLGPLRLALAVGVLVVLVFAPRPGTAVVVSGWAMIPTLIVPVLAPLLFMLLMLDALMARVHMTSVRGEPLARYRRIMRVQLVLGLVLLGYWLPYFIALRGP